MREKTGNAWLNVEVTDNTAGVIAYPDDPKVYTFLLPTRSVNQPTRITVKVPTNPLMKNRNETPPTEIPSRPYRKTGRNGLSIVDANPETAMFDMRNQKWRPLGISETYLPSIQGVTAQ